MKWIGILCLFLMCSAIGFYAAGKIHARYRSTQKLAALLNEFSTMLRYQCTPLEELLVQFAHNPNYSEFSFISDICNGFSVNISPGLLWESSVCNDPLVMPSAGDILCSLGNVLGTTDMQGQLAALEMYCSRMEAAAEDIKTDCIRKEELYRRIGVLIGAMCAVLMI